jgi:hypothetical protein
MAPKSRVVSSSSSTTPPLRPPESDIEILYNTAVQSFVRRDHGKTQAALARLLKYTESLEDSKRNWYDLEGDSGGQEEQGNEWRIKILKLVISANASLYSDPPVNVGSVPPELAALLPPSSPDLMLGHIQTICTDTLSNTDLLPPAIVSTLLLASLKLKPSPRALDFAHHLAETWIAGLPDDFIRTISSTSKVPTQSPQVKKRIEGCREGYLKVIELFVGEVLPREGDFEMARALLDGEGVMSSKRKEDLYRHLRSTESRSINSTSYLLNHLPLPCYCRHLRRTVQAGHLDLDPQQPVLARVNAQRDLTLMELTNQSVNLHIWTYPKIKAKRKNQKLSAWIRTRHSTFQTRSTSIHPTPKSRLHPPVAPSRRLSGISPVYSQ